MQEVLRRLETPAVCHVEGIVQGPYDTIQQLTTRLLFP